MNNYRKPWYKTYIKKNILIDGFTVGNSAPGENSIILQKAFITSFEDRFYLYLNNISGIFDINVSQINNLLIIIDDSNTAKIYRDEFPIGFTIKAKRDVKKFSLLHLEDIIEVSEIDFSDAYNDINPKQGEKIIWLFRLGFTFGFYFDLSKKLTPQNAKNEMGKLFQKVAYIDLYNKLDDQLLDKTIKNGWFPFLQIIGNHNDFLQIIDNKKSTGLIEWAERLFTNDRIKDFTSKWFKNEFFIPRIKSINEGLECFYEGKYAAAISTLIPMVEGVANVFFLRTTGKGINYKGNDIAEHIDMIAKKKYNEDSLTFAKHFKQYLLTYYFKNNSTPESTEAVRNTISHGRAIDESFTRENAIKVILTLDQLYYFL